MAAFKGMLVAWATELEEKGLPGAEALKAFKAELSKVGVDFNACPY